MKKLALITTLLTSSMTQAYMMYSDYNERHNSTIEKAIDLKCGKLNTLAVVSTKKERVKVDQGIVDYKYTTEINATAADYTRYSVTVKSWYYDSYDHESQDWGSYSVESVECTLK